MSVTHIEDTLIAHIKGVLGRKVKGVESLPGDWDDEMLNRLQRAVPGVFVIFSGGARDNGAGALEAAINGRFTVLTATGHASGEAARRRGDAQQIGAYDLVQVLAAQLHGLLVPNVGSLSLVSVSNLYTGVIDTKGLAVYAIEFALPVTFELQLPEDALAPFETFDAQLDVPPFSGAQQHRQWLAGDYSQSLPDARDTVQLPQA